MYKIHLFVCTNHRTQGASCGAKGGRELRDAIKEKCRALKGVRVNASGCLGFCERGITAVTYPQGEWEFELENSAEAIEKISNRVRVQLDDLLRDDT